METKLTVKDLMIGDWVNIYKFTNDKQQIKDLFPAKVVSILQGNEKENYNTIECVYGTKIASRPADTCLPIPLTAEILEKNGIKWLMSEPSGKRTYSCNEPPISCTFIPDRGWYLSAGPVGSTKLPFAEISMAYYVHELQHALRLCHIDKEIVL